MATVPLATGSTWPACWNSAKRRMNSARHPPPTPQVPLSRAACTCSNSVPSWIGQPGKGSAIRGSPEWRARDKGPRWVGGMPGTRGAGVSIGRDPACHQAAAPFGIRSGEGLCLRSVRDEFTTGPVEISQAALAAAARGPATIDPVSPVTFDSTPTRGAMLTGGPVGHASVGRR